MIVAEFTELDSCPKTDAAPENPEPVTTTVVPTAPLAGLNDVTFGPATTDAGATPSPNALVTITAKTAATVARVPIDTLHPLLALLIDKQEDTILNYERQFL